MLQWMRPILTEIFGIFAYHSQWNPKITENKTLKLFL